MSKLKTIAEMVAEIKEREEQFYQDHPQISRFGEEDLTMGDFTVKVVYGEAEDFTLDEDERAYGIVFMGGRLSDIGAECPVDVRDFLMWKYSNDFDVEKEDNWKFIQFSKNYHWTPVYIYEHSGITINTTGFSCRWDSGLGGMAFISKKEFADNGYYGVTSRTKADIREELAQHFLDTCVAELDDMITNNVFSYEVIDSEEDCVDSCCGFIGNFGRMDAISDGIAVAKRLQKELDAEKEETEKFLCKAREADFSGIISEVASNLVTKFINSPVEERIEFLNKNGYTMSQIRERLGIEL